jgi:hypothetical protein
MTPSLKSLLPFLSLVAVPASVFAADKPSGLLGVDAVSFGYTYYHNDNSYYHVSDSCAYSLNLLLNKNLWENADYGLDARARYFYISELSGSNYYDEHQHNGELGANFFMKGRIRPYVGASTYFRHMVTNDKVDDLKLTNNEWQLEGRGGVEFIISPEFSANVQIAETHNCAASSPQNFTRYSAGVAYWLTDRIGFSTTVTYTPINHTDDYSTIFGVLYHF